MGLTAAHSLEEYVQIICDQDKIAKSNQTEHLLFRGQADESYELLPSIARNRHSAFDDTIFNQERNLIEMAKYRLPDVFRKDMLPVELLALLQHYGIPTRLLDVTENALVALYFACKDNNANGEVIVFKEISNDIVNYPIINAIADSYRLANSTMTRISMFYERLIEQPYCIEQRWSMNYLWKTEKQKTDWVKSCCSNLLFIYAPVTTARQQAQSGRYILFPNRIDDKSYADRYFAQIIDAIPKDHKSIAERIIIPQDVKIEILEKLKLFGISEDKLFIDNIDIVCKNIVDRFKPRKGKELCPTST